MTIPVWVLLGFAAWTLLTLSLTVGVYRWGLVFLGRAQIKDFRADAVEGSDFYKRAMRAHANCVENLPVYAAVVLATHAAGVNDHTLDVLALTVLGARVLHTTLHVAVVQTNVVGGVRFSFFMVQLVCMAWMGIHVAVAARG